MTTRSVAARWVFPVAGPPLPGGVVTVADGRIVSVEPVGRRTPDEDLGNVALIPGLVNPHTHLDLSGARGLLPPTDADHFPDWLLAVIAFRRNRTPEQVSADIRAGLVEAMRFGTTLLGDISADGGSWEPLLDSPIRAVVFRELLGLSQQRSDDAIRAADMWLRCHELTDTIWPGLSPHAPYSVRRTLFAAAGKLSARRECPLAVHLAESDSEAELLSHRRGAMVPFLQGLGVWEGADFATSFADVINQCDFGQPLLLVHANRLSPSQSIPLRSSVVYCPRTHAAFGHPPHPFRDFLARGVNVCLGTDSLASNPDLDPLAEARFLHARYPDVPGETLLRMVTHAGAVALGWGDGCGTLEPGKSADLVAVPLPDADGEPHGLLLANAPAARRTMFRGEWRDIPGERGA